MAGGSERAGDGDGSDIFWPGYVDATTNLILNLLFLLTILISAVFMFALELGRSVPKDEAMISKIESTIEVKSEQKVDVETSVEIRSEPQEVDDSTPSASELQAENIALRTEIKRLNMLLAQRASKDMEEAGSSKTLVTEKMVEHPKKIESVEQTLSFESEVIVKFRDEAVTFTKSEHQNMQDELKPIAESEQASIYVRVPSGFSEAKRMGFYRAMSVRNLLIEMGMETGKIDVAVVEEDLDANASLVRVRAY
ncbi:MAG: hypothetical protein C0621_05500 [Desulfuromonas sp.]|nr:MAG: hypothetical protein C0621_05500 [Desulfuromonas sp.]